MWPNLGNAVLTISANISGAIAGLQQVANQVQGFGQTVQNVGRTLSSLGVQVGAIGVALNAALAPAVIQGAKFEHTMSAVKAVVNELAADVTDASGKFAELNAKAKELGLIQFGAGQVADAMKSLGQAGFDTQQIMAGIAPVLSLAAAGELTLGEAATIAADNMRAFKLRAEDINRVSDVMAAVAAASTIEVRDVAESMKYVSPIAATLGQRIEEVASAIGLLGNVGLKGSIAGTSLSYVFQRLVKDSDKIDAVMKRYGASFEAVNPAVHSLTDVILEFKRANLSTMDIVKLFRIEGGKAIMALMSTSEEAILAMRDVVDNSLGAAAEQAAIRLKNLQGTWVQFRASLEGLNVTIFETLKADLTEILKWATKTVNEVILWIEQNQEFTRTIFLVVGAFSALATVAGAVLLTVGTFVGIMGGSIVAISFVTANIEILLGVLAGVGVAIAVATPVIYAMIGAWDSFSAMIQVLWRNVLEPFIEGFGKGLVFAWETYIKPALDDLATAFAATFTALGAAFSKLDPDWWVEYGKVIGTVVGLLVGGFARAITLVTQLIAVNVIEMRRLLDEYINLMSFGTIKGVQGLADAFGMLKSSVSEANSELENTARLMNAGGLAAISQQGGEFADSQKSAVKEQQELVSLLVKKQDLTVQELTTMEKLRDKYTDTKKVLEDTVNLLKTKADEQEKIRQQIQRDLTAANRAGDRPAVDKLNDARQIDEATRRKLKGELDIATANLRDYSEAAKDAESRANAGPEKIKLLKEYAAMMEAAKKAQFDGPEEHAFEKAKAELSVKQLEGMEKEIDKAERLKEKYDELLDSRIENLNVQRQGLLANSQLRGEKPSARGEINADYDSQVAEIQALKVRNAEKTVQTIAQVQKKAAEKRDAYTTSLQIKAAKEAKNNTLAASLEADKMIADHKAKADELFQLDGKNDEAIKRQRAAADAAVQADADLVRKEGIKKDEEAAKKASQHGRLGEKENAAEKHLANQVKTVQDMYAYYVAISNIKGDMERRAVASIKTVFELQRRLDALQLKADADPTNKSLQNKVRRLQETLQIRTAMAKSRLTDANLSVTANLPPVAPEKRTAEEVVAATNALSLQVTILADTAKDRIDALMERVVKTVEKMRELHDEVLQLNEEDEPELSLEEYKKKWARELEESRKTTSNLPNLPVDGIMSSSVKPLSADSQQPVASIGTNNDSRNFSMTINNNFDIDNVKRQLGNAMRSAASGRGNV